MASCNSLNASGDVQYEFTANQAGDTQITLDDSGGVGSATDLNVTNRTATTLDIESSTGSDATVPFATDTLAGLMTAADKDKLDILATALSTLPVAMVLQQLAITLQLTKLQILPAPCQ